VQIRNNGGVDRAGGRSRMAIIYEQQSWEGEIVKERDMKQGRKASQAIPRSMETVLGGRRPSQCAEIAAKLEGEEGVKW